MRILAFILLCGVMFGLSGCSNFMTGFNEYKYGNSGRAPKAGEGILNWDASKYYRGEIQIVTEPAGLEVELYNRGELLKSKEDLGYFKAQEMDEERRNDLRNIANTSCYGAALNGSYSQCAADGDQAKQELREKTSSQYMDEKFAQGLERNTTPTTARLTARTPENKASKYVLVFKKNGKEIARKEIKPSINWWAYLDPFVFPFGTLIFSSNMGWNWWGGEKPHLTQTRSYLTQGG